MTSIDFAALLREERRKREKARSAPPAALLAERQALDLEAHRVGADVGLRDCFYVPNFLSAEEASSLQAAAQQAGTGAEAGSLGVGPSWASLPGRRLLNLGGVPNASGMFVEPLPHFAAALADGLVQAGVFEPDSRPDQFLINEYFESQGIDAHRDGPLYRPQAAIVSLGSPAVLDFFEAAGPAPEDTGSLGGGAVTSEGRLLQRRASVALEPNSLLLFSGHAYADLWHGISSNTECEDIDDLCVNRGALQVEAPWRRGYRISFTVRKAAVVAERPATAEGEAEARRRHAHWLRAVADKQGGARAKPSPQALRHLGGKLLARGGAAACV